MKNCNQDDYEQLRAIRIWTRKKMIKFEKKLASYASSYFGCPVTIRYFNENNVEINTHLKKY